MVKEDDTLRAGRGGEELRAQPAVLILPSPIRPHYACRIIPLQAQSNKNNLGRNLESGWMLSSGEDKPGSEALLSEPRLGWLTLM